MSGSAGGSHISADTIKMPRGRLAGAGFGVALMIGLLALAVLPGLEEAGMAERVSGHLAALGSVGAVVLVAIMAFSVVIGPVPTAPFAVAAGMVYGAGAGAALALGGGLLGAVLAFLIARAAGRPLIDRLTGILQTPRWMQGDGSLFRIVLLARLVPVLSFALVSYAAGLSAVSLRAFILATALGMAPMTVACATLGGSLDSGAFGPAIVAILVATVLGLHVIVGRRRQSPLQAARRPRQMATSASTKAS